MDKKLASKPHEHSLRTSAVYRDGKVIRTVDCLECHTVLACIESPVQRVPDADDPDVQCYRSECELWKTREAEKAKRAEALMHEHMAGLGIEGKPHPWTNRKKVRKIVDDLLRQANWEARHWRELCSR